MNINENLEIIYAVVNSGEGSRCLHLAKDYGVKGGTILLGRGMDDNALLNILSLYDQKKEVVVMGSDEETAEHVLEILNKKYRFDKANHGMAFTISLCGVGGSSCYKCQGIKEENEVEKEMYRLITTIVNKGKAEEVIDAATKAGAKGGTIINARGSGIHETSKLFNMDIEPEKEMVIILTKPEMAEKIVLSIQDNLELDKPGNGIVFVQTVHSAYGMIE